VGTEGAVGVPGALVGGIVAEPGFNKVLVTVPLIWLSVLVLVSSSVVLFGATTGPGCDGTGTDDDPGSMPLTGATADTDASDGCGDV